MFYPLRGWTAWAGLQCSPTSRTLSLASSPFGRSGGVYDDDDDESSDDDDVDEDDDDDALR